VTMREVLGSGASGIVRLAEWEGQGLVICTLVEHSLSPSLAGVLPCPIMCSQQLSQFVPAYKPAGNTSLKCPPSKLLLDLI